MNPGPELDRAIAEQVMGWKANPNPDKYRAESINRYGQPVLDVANIGHNCDAYDEVIFQPSTNIAHAWEVVEYMTQTTKESWEFTHYTTLQIAIFEFDGGRERPWKPGQYVGEALTMPHAICLAALAAVNAKP